MIEPVKAIRITWDSLSRIMSEEISKMLGREIRCRASMNDVEYWAIVIQDERIPLSELFKILETVKANEAERQDSLPESALTEFSVRDIGMKAANLILSSPLITISRQLQKSLVKQLKDQRRGGKQTGLMMGRRLDAHALCRNDGKVFYKNNLPQEMPELAVGLLLDESGSMCSCDRCTYARAAAIILYDFCRSLDIPVTVYGHSTDYYDGHGSVELYSYAEFDGFDNDDKYRLMDISARGSNRDGAALRYVAEQLSKRPETVKILILVSDGQPADSGYYGTAAEEDLRGIKQEYQRKGILFVAAAIGNDKQNIERI